MAPVLRPGGAAVGLGGRERGMGWLVPGDANPDLPSNSPGRWGGGHWAARLLGSRGCHRLLGLLGLRHQGLFLSSRRRNGSLLSQIRGPGGTRQPPARTGARLAPCLRLCSQPTLGWSPQEPWELPGQGPRQGQRVSDGGAEGSPGLPLGLWGHRGQVPHAPSCSLGIAPEDLDFGPDLPSLH